MQVKNGFQIGDLVWRATWEYSQSYVTCPDCGGTRALTFVMYDGTEHTIDCAGCASGYEPPRGVLPVGNYKPEASPHTVTGMKLRTEGGFEYTLNNGFYIGEENLFATKEEAQARAEALGQEKAAEDLSRIYKKEKDTRSWAWHVHYHRREIKEAQRRLDYHTKKLCVAKEKAKIPKNEIGQSHDDKVSA